MLMSKVKSVKVTINRFYEGQWSWSYHVEGEGSDSDGIRTTAWGSAKSIGDAWDAAEEMLVSDDRRELSEKDLLIEEPAAPESEDGALSDAAHCGDIVGYVGRRPGTTLTDIRRFMKSKMKPSCVAESLEFLVRNNALRREYKRASKTGRRTYYYYPNGK